MQYDPHTRTFDCDPSLTDSQVVAFCRDGHLLLKGVVPPEINQRAIDYLEGRLPANPSWMPPGMTMADVERIRGSHEPSVIMLEDWFVEGVLLNPQVAGVMRALLGRNVGLPVLASSHRIECPAPAQPWHYDADHVFGPELNFLEVFYFPQDTPIELGPTEFVPGTHVAPVQRAEEHGGQFAAGPAGTIGIHHQSILHRRGRSTASGTRHMLKYNYWRTTAPTRDWIAEPDFDLRTADYGGHNHARYAAHTFCWLCGKGDEYRILGGQAWPWRSRNQIGPSYGFGVDHGYRPDWRKQKQDGYVD